jgi:hypothetical protein
MHVCDAIYVCMYFILYLYIIKPKGASVIPPYVCMYVVVYLMYIMYDLFIICDH